MINFLRIKEDKRLFNALKTGFSSISIKLISVILSMVTVPMTLSYLGKERYGIWLTISSTLAFISFADFGLGNNLVNSISKAHANNNLFFAKIEISNSFFLMCVISVIISVLFVFFGFNSSLIQRGIQLNEEVRNTLILVFSLVIFGLPFAISQRILEGYQEGYRYQLFLLVNTILGFLMILLFTKLKLGMPYLAFAFLTPTIFANFTSSFFIFFFLNQI